MPWSRPKFEPPIGLPGDVRHAVRRRDWSVIERYFADLPAGEDPTWSVLALSNIGGSEKFYRDAVNRTEGSALALTLLGAHLVVIAWKHRTGYFARYVTQDQANLFHEYLCEAERVLADATAAEPVGGVAVAAWNARLQTNRGLGFGQAEEDRRYARAAAAFPHPLSAQRNHVQGMCPKWGGTFERVHRFTAAAAAAAPHGTPHGGLVADGHLEHVLTLRGRAREDYSDRADAIESVRAAAARSVFHPDASVQPGWLWAHTVFAAFYSIVGMSDAARPHLVTMGRRSAEGVWNRVWGNPAAAWAAARERAGL